MNRHRKICFGLVVAIALLAGPFPAWAQVAAPAVDLGATAVQFARDVLSGNQEGIAAAATEQVKAAFAGKGESIRDTLSTQLGTLKELGTPWWEGEENGLVAYRVPADFERAAIDLRVVFDGEGRVAGFFTAVRREPSGGAPAEAAEKKAVPLPEGVRERELTLGDSGHGLAARLTLPAGAGPFPGAVLVHGSGPNDMDGTVGPNTPLRDLAYGLSARGVAVLRYDKRSRTYPGELLALGDALTVEQVVVADARAALALLAEQPEVDGHRLYVVGHSLGAMLAPRIAASAQPRPAGLVSLAGLTRPLPETMLDQTRYIAQADGTVSDQEQAQIDQLAATVADLRRRLTAGGPPPEEALLGVPFSFWQDLEGYDPPAAAAALGLPVLVVQGGRDYQVTMDDFTAWKQGLAGKPGICLELYPKLDHLLRSGEGPSTPQDYLQRAAPVDPQLLNEVAAWIGAGTCPQHEDAPPAP